ncbi:MAG: helix-turn-helix transcriptional regulator, partial [Peptostreptococcaceae bacterium]
MRKKLRELRKKNNMTQQNIAKELCIDRSHYSRIENGHKGVTLDNALRLK